MQDDGVRPDTRTLTALICALGAGGLVDDALATFRTMASALLASRPCRSPGSCHDPRVACGVATCKLLPLWSGVCSFAALIERSESECHSLEGSLLSCCVPVFSWPQLASAVLHVCTGGYFSCFLGVTPSLPGLQLSELVSPEGACPAPLASPVLLSGLQLSRLF